MSKEDKLKAWRVWVSDKRENGVSVVFAETQGKAKTIAMNCDVAYGEPFTSIRAVRIPELDGEYRGYDEMNWNDDDDRLAMVTLAKIECEYPVDWECETCVARSDCNAYFQAHLDRAEDELDNL